MLCSHAGAGYSVPVAGSSVGGGLSLAGTYAPHSFKAAIFRFSPFRLSFSFDTSQSGEHVLDIWRQLLAHDIVRQPTQ